MTNDFKDRYVLGEGRPQIADYAVYLRMKKENVPKRIRVRQELRLLLRQKNCPQYRLVLERERRTTMGCEYICDGCGKRMFAFHNGRNWIKPLSWFQRSDDDGPQDACCRECIGKIAKKTGKTNVVLPI